MFAAVSAQGAWKPDGSLLSPVPGAVAASDGRGGVFGATGYPVQFTWLYHLAANGDPAIGWPAAGLALTPAMTLSEHTSIAPVAALPDGKGGSYILTDAQAPYNGHGGFLYPVQLYLHRRTASGEVAAGWSANGVQLETPWLDHRYEVCHLPCMVSDGKDGVLVAWLFLGNWPGPRVVVQRVTADGSLKWGVDGVLAEHSSGTCTLPALAADGMGGVLVFWGRWDSSGTSIRVIGQHVQASGALLWGPNGRAISKGSYDRMAEAVPADGGWVWAHYAAAISVTPDGEGGATLCWAGSQGEDLNVFATRVAPDGRLPWRRELPVCSAPGEQASVVSTPLGRGGAVVAWRDGRNGADVGIFAQAISDERRTLWTLNGVAACTGPGERGPVVMAPGGRDAVYLAWADPRQGGQVFAQRLLDSGRRSPGWPVNGALVSRTAQPYVNSSGLQLVAGRLGSAIAVWSDARYGSLSMLLTREGLAADHALPTETTDVPAATHAAAFALHGVQPNPVTTNGIVSFALSEATPATLELVDIAGRRVWSREVGDLGPGEHTARLSDGARLPSGVYFVRLIQGTHVAATRVTLLR
jgi:hypothetical protein